MSLSLFLILTLLINGSQAVILPIPEYALQNVHADQETIRHDFLLVETLLYDFLNIFTRPVEIVQLNKQPFGKDIRTVKEKSIDTTTPINEEAKIAEELTNVLKDLPMSTFVGPEKFHGFIQSMTKIGMDECVHDLAKLIDSAANALLATTYCHLTGLNETHMKSCFDAYLLSRGYATQVLDAWGRPPSGIYSSGPFFWLGAYDQCLNLPELKPNQSVQYCRANVRVEARGMQRRIPLFYGMCLPARCNERYARGAFSIASRFLKKTLGIQISSNSTVECYKQKVPFFKKIGTAQWIILGILMFLILMVFCGTVMDFYCKRRCKKYLVNKDTSTSRSHTIRLPTSARSIALSEMSSKGTTPCVQDDTKSFIYTDAPSQALTYKSAPAVRRTLKKWNCFPNAVLAFSARSTYHYLLRPSKRHLNSLHGIRVLSAFWVVLGHAHLLSLEYVGNVRHLWSSLKASDEFSEIIFNASLSVDSFLLISGTVLAYKIHSRITHQKKQQNAPKAALSLCGWMAVYIHRITRLIPAYLIILLIIYFIFQYTGDGPMWSQRNGVFGARCDGNDFWRQLLFVSNFYPNECMPWMWYLALDTQFYLVAPLALILLHNAPTIGTVFIFIVILLSILYRVTVTILFRFPTTLASALIASDELATQTLEKMFKYLYAAPQARIGPFFIGMVLGWLLAMKPKHALSIIHIDIIRVTSFVMLGFSLFGAHYASSYSIFSIFYVATFRVFWASGLALLVWLCERGYMYPIRCCLAWDKWILLSRLSYGFYLSHEPILLYFVWTRRSAIMPQSTLYFVVFAIEISMLSLIVAAITAFLIEVPPLIIERKIFKTIRARASPNGIDEETERSEMKCESTAQLQSERNEKMTELAPMLPPMSRTKRWIEENQNDLQGSSGKTAPTVPLETEGNTTAPDRTALWNNYGKYRDQNDAADNTDSVSTCKSFSEKSTNGKQNFKSKPFPASYSPVRKLPKTKRRFWSYTDGAKDKDICSKHPLKHPHIIKTVDESSVQKRKMPVKQKHIEGGSTLEHIGFSWIEEVAKRLDAEENAPPPPSQEKKRKTNQRGDFVIQQQQHFGILPLAEQAPLSGKSSSTTNTGETVIHVFKHRNLNESDL